MLPAESRAEALAARLETVEGALRSAPDDVALLLARAHLFFELGRTAQAKEAYLAVLLHDRYYCEAMLGLGEVFIEGGDVASARVVLSEAVARHPTSAAAHSALGSVLLEEDELGAAQDAFVTALRLNPLHRKAWCGLAVALERKGHVDAADRAWREAFKENGPALSTYRGAGEPTRILLLWSAVDGNIPLKPVLDDRLFQWSTFFVESYDDAMTLPPHAVVFNAVGNADLRTRALDMAHRVVRATSASILNHPSLVEGTTRVAVADRLRALPGVVTPRMLTVARSALLAPAAERLLDESGFAWPLLVRSPGFHTGEHFALVARSSELREIVAGLPGEELLVISYLDTRDADGIVRKYRVLSIDGVLYPLHLAASREWKVHYFSAEMTVERRDEERCFLEDPRGAIGDNAVRVLEGIAATLQLDYGGIDFTLDAAGRIVVFEANATMAIVPPGNATEEDYRREPIRRAIEAAQGMIVRRSLR